MHNVVEIKNLYLNFNDKKVFDNLHLSIKDKHFVTVLGRHSSGKSLLAKIMAGLIKTDGDVIIDGVSYNEDSAKYLNKKIGIVFENSNQQFVHNTVYEELSFILGNLNYYPVDIDEKIDKYTKLFGIDNLLNREIVSLSAGEKQLVSIVSAIIYEPSILILDEALSMLDNYYREIILKTFGVLRKRGLTIIYFTSNSADSIYGTDIAIINNGKIIMNKPLLKALKEEKKFISSGIEIPFMANVSLKLRYYNLIDKIYLDEKSLVNAIWK